MTRMAVFYFVSFWTAIVVQFSWSRYAGIHGIAPNVILVALMFIGLSRGPMAGQIMGFLWGLAWDSMNVELFGSHTLVLTCMGFLSGRFSRMWDESKVVPQIALAGITSVLYQLSLLLVYKLFAPSQDLATVNYVVLLQPFFNMAIAPFVFLLARFFPETRRIGSDFEGFI